jgi:hypothetical protein
MAVLMMVFAALLGATFITVVAANVQGSARSDDKAEAQSAARAGMRLMQQRLAQDGLNWRPKDKDPAQQTPPQPGDASFRAYYDDFDLARGWATTGVAPNDARYNSDGFVKYPDPRVTGAQARVLPFMAKIEKVARGDADNAQGDKTGNLRITVIGRSNDNMAAFDKLVDYVAGTAQQPLTSNMRSVTNWDFVTANVPSGKVASPVTNSKTVPLTQVSGRFPVNAHFYVTLNTAQAVQFAVVQSYVSSGVEKGVLTLAAPLSIPAGARVEMAGALGAPPYINYDNSANAANSPTIDTANERVDLNLSSAATPGSVRVNGGLLWFGEVRAANLRSRESANATSASSPISAFGAAPASTGAVRASGVMQIVAGPPAPEPSSTPLVRISGQYFDGRTSQTLNDAPLSNSSADRAFPGSGAGWDNMTASQKAQLVDDGWNRLAGNVTGDRQVQSFMPPDITSGVDGVSRYRQKTKFSKPVNPADGASASLYGYGEGLYINNPQDRERVGTGANTYRDMTPIELRNLWFSSVAGSSTRSTEYYRLSEPSSASSTNKSLEQQHLRGWIGPDEFRARGALLEINSDNTLTISLDPRDEGPSFNKGPAPHKGWRNPDGTLMGHPTAGGVYQRTVPWPANGIVFAEGNLRVRGTATNPPRSLTVVSMNNIYIEDSLGAGNRKILLLARKNVVLNPTAVMSRTDHQTLLRTAIRASATAPVRTLPVYDASGFRPGDWIYLDNSSSNSQDVCVQSVYVSGNGNDSITLLPSTSVKSNQTILRPVKAKTDPPSSSSTPPYRFSRLQGFSQGLQRRFQLPANNAGEVRIALRHSAERKAGLTVPYIRGINPLAEPSEAQLSMKLAANGQTTLIHPNEKFLTLMDGPNVLDQFGITYPMAANDKPTNYNLKQSELQADRQPGWMEYRLKARTAPAWHYWDVYWNYPGDPTPTSLVRNNYGAKYAPYYFLAAVGNRLDAGTVPSGTFPWRKNIKTLLRPGSAANFEYDIPMATSVIATLNGVYSNQARAGIRSDTWNGSDYERVGQFGFNPFHGFVAAPGTSTDQTEDVLTVDQSFYSLSTAAGGPNNYTLDSRTFAGATGGTNSLTLRLNDAVVEGATRVEDYFNNLTSLQVPTYFLSRIKLENATLNADHQFETLRPGHVIDVRAFVYAQEGSWIVIPGDFFDPAVKNNSDLDRDGVLSRAEQVAAYRFNRFNYKINFTGAIMENQSAIINDPDGSSGPVIGAVADWMNKWATVNIDAGNFTGTGAGGMFRNDLSYAAGDFPNITYVFDDEAMRGLFDEDDGFHLPVAPEPRYGS